MKKRFILSLALLFLFTELLAQDLATYINENTATFNKNNMESVIIEDGIVDADIVFFGFIHGAATPQIVDFKLLEYLVKEKGIRHYAPEVDYSQAYFLNRYLETGDTKLLDFAIHFYQRRVPQDASVQFKEKWMNIFQLNQSLPKDDKIEVIGTDFPSYDKRIAITHLAHLIGETKTGDKMLDSLKQYKSTKIDNRAIFSGAPAIPKIKQYGGFTYDYVYPINSKFNFTNRFIRYYEANKEELKEQFEKLEIDIENILEKKSKDREQHIFQSFKEQIIPISASGKKVYSNFGYAHIHQKEIYNRCFLACMLKNDFPKLNIVSILGLLTHSTVLKDTKWKKSKEVIIERGLEFKRMEYKGFKTSKSYDGHGMFEKLLGINALIKANKSKEILFLDLQKEGSPFAKKPYLVAYQRGGKDINVDANSNTLDYFQYVVLMRNSKPNIPIEEMNR